jgi:hypothetical protein
MNKPASSDKEFVSDGQESLSCNKSVEVVISDQIVDSDQCSVVS